MTTISMDSDRHESLPEGAAVARYLEAHPEFFNHHLELLNRLAIPHATGPAVSLWERQIAALRADNERLRTRYEEFLTQATRNEALIGRIHALSLALMQAAGPQAVFALLATRLSAEFNADRVTVRIYGAPAFVDSEDTPQFVGSDAPDRTLFEDLLDGSAPLCGVLAAPQVQALFGGGNGAVASGSHVLLPLAGRHWAGLLAVSSHDPRRFDARMGTEFLGYLRDVLIIVLEPWVAKPKRNEGA